MTRSRAGFTLIEALAVVLMIAIVLGMALDYYVNLSNASVRAAEHTRDIRRAVAVLDRVTRDLEGSYLVMRPPEVVDAIEWPWVFLGESRQAEGGSDHLKFFVRNHEPRREDARQSDVSQIVYMVRAGSDDDLELVRWASSEVPDGLDRSFPLDDDDGVQLLADGLETFRVRFLDEAGEWVESWDSSQIEQSGQLPLAAEVQVTMAEFDAYAPEEAVRYTRQVLLPVRPVDLTTLLDPTGGDGEGPTLADCLVEGAITGGSLASLDASQVQALAQAVKLAKQPFSTLRHLVGSTIPVEAVNPDCL